MMLVQDALTELGLKPGATHDKAAAEQAFARLARRYPPSQFPERFQRLLAARAVLVHEDRSWHDFITAPAVDLSWAADKLRDLDHAGAAAPVSSAMMFQDVLREAYKSAPLGELPDEIGPFDGFDFDLDPFAGGHQPGAIDLEKAAEELMRLMKRKKPIF